MHLHFNLKYLYCRFGKYICICRKICRWMEQVNSSTWNWNNCFLHALLSVDTDARVIISVHGEVSIFNDFKNIHIQSLCILVKTQETRSYKTKCTFLLHNTLNRFPINLCILTSNDTLITTFLSIYSTGSNANGSMRGLAIT